MACSRKNFVSPYIGPTSMLPPAYLDIAETKLLGTGVIFCLHHGTPWKFDWKLNIDKHVKARRQKNMRFPDPYLWRTTLWSRFWKSDPLRHRRWTGIPLVSWMPMVTENLWAFWKCPSWQVKTSPNVELSRGMVHYQKSSDPCRFSPIGNGSFGYGT